MRPLLPLVAVTVLAAPASAQDWVTIPLGTTSDVNALERTSFGQIIAVGDAGLALQSTDDTQTVWMPLAVGTSADLLAVHQPSWTQIWIGGSGGTVRRQISGTFVGRDVPSAEDFVIFSRVSGWSFAGGSGGSLYSTTDGGNSWDFQFAVGASIRDGGFSGLATIAVGDLGAIVTTTDNGDTWTPVVSGTAANLYAVLGVAGNAVLAAGQDGTMLRSSDSGSTWAAVTVPTSETIWDLDASLANANWVLAAGSAGTLLRSTDGGQSWCSIDPQTTANLYAVDMSNNNAWTIAGAGGLLKRTENQGGGCFDPIAAPAPGPSGSFRLAGPWPQPVVGVGTFALQIERGQKVRVDLVDVAGRHVASVMDGQVPAGESRRLAVDTSSLAAGVYFLRAQGEDFSETRRVVVAR
ncbi:MAG: YCF48-related protein [bacterium]